MSLSLLDSRSLDSYILYVPGNVSMITFMKWIVALSDDLSI